MSSSRACDLADGKYVSNAALEAILGGINEHGIPDAISRSTIKRQRVADVYADDASQFGPVIVSEEFPATEGEDQQVHFQHPIAMLSAIMAVSIIFRELFISVVEASGGNISFIIYTDEVTPGNALLHDNRRKGWAFYWSIAEFGSEILANEDAWFCGFFLRCSTEVMIRGGLPVVIKHFMKLLFGPPGSLDFRNGVMFRLPEKMLLVFAKIKMAVADEGAHKKMESVMGASGVKICLLCQNVVKKGSRLLPSRFLVAITTLDPTLIKLHTTATVKRLYERLAQEAAHRPHHLEETETAWGYKYAPESWLQDPLLDICIIDIFSWDWMHVYLQSGILAVELAALSAELGNACAEGLDKYLKLWQWPRGYAGASQIAEKGHRIDGS